MRDIYIYPIDECDVLDKASLKRFRDKRIAWVDALDDDTDHAIWQTLSQMVWREVTYDAIANIADHNPGSALNNRLIGETILDGHATLEVLAVRRLIDDRRDVISLTRLLRDIRSNRNLLTRENFICFDGMPYDYARVQNEELAEALSASILYAGGRMHALMPTAQFDQFEFLDREAMPKDALAAAAKRWHDVSESYDDALGDVDQQLFAP